MKKFTTILLTILMVISLTACAGGNDLAEEKTTETKGTTENGFVDETEEPKTLVVFFSATNITEGVVDHIAGSLVL